MGQLYLILLAIVCFIGLYVIFGSFFTVETAEVGNHEIREIPAHRRSGTELEIPVLRYCGRQGQLAGDPDYANDGNKN